MKYAVKMGSGAMIYKPSFIKTGSSIDRLLWGGGGIRGPSMVVSQAHFYFFETNRFRSSSLGRGRSFSSHVVLTGSGAHPASCPMGTGYYFPVG
jgi:hypothetical protein